jgi:hypothetical protein
MGHIAGVGPTGTGATDQADDMFGRRWEPDQLHWYGTRRGIQAGVPSPTRASPIRKTAL